MTISIGLLLSFSNFFPQDEDFGRTVTNTVPAMKVIILFPFRQLSVLDRFERHEHRGLRDGYPPE